MVQDGSLFEWSSPLFFFLSTSNGVNESPIRNEVSLIQLSIVLTSSPELEAPRQTKTDWMVGHLKSEPPCLDGMIFDVRESRIFQLSTYGSCQSPPLRML